MLLAHAIVMQTWVADEGHVSRCPLRMSKQPVGMQSCSSIPGDGDSSSSIYRILLSVGWNSAHTRLQASALDLCAAPQSLHFGPVSSADPVTPQPELKIPLLNPYG